MGLSIRCYSSYRVYPSFHLQGSLNMIFLSEAAMFFSLGSLPLLYFARAEKRALRDIFRKNLPLAAHPQKRDEEHPRVA